MSSTIRGTDAKMYSEVSIFGGGGRHTVVAMEGLPVRLCVALRPSDTHQPYEPKQP